MEKKIFEIWRKESDKEVMDKALKLIKAGNLGEYFVAVVPAPFIAKSVRIVSKEEKKVMVEIEYKTTRFFMEYKCDENTTATFVVSVDKDMKNV